MQESSSKGTGGRQAMGAGQGGEEREAEVEGAAKRNAPRGREYQGREQRGAVTR